MHTPQVFSGVSSEQVSLPRRAQSGAPVQSDRTTNTCSSLQDAHGGLTMAAVGSKVAWRADAVSSDMVAATSPTGTGFTAVQARPPRKAHCVDKYLHNIATDC